MRKMPSRLGYTMPQWTLSLQLTDRFQAEQAIVDLFGHYVIASFHHSPGVVTNRAFAILNSVYEKMIESFYPEMCLFANLHGDPSICFIQENDHLASLHVCAVLHNVTR